MDPIKEAFSKIKEDICSLNEEINHLKEQLKSLKNSPNPSNYPTHNSTYSDPVYSLINQQTNTQTHNSTYNTDLLPLEGLKSQNTGISTGNEGVPTDKPTDTQTDQQTQKDPISEFKKANEILSSLDDIKREIRRKFRQLTNQEMKVFSTLYLFEDQNIPEITYKTLAKELNLSESSIRDYINRLLNKGILIEKVKQNNKTILLKISSDLRNVASLQTIVRLRDL